MRTLVASCLLAFLAALLIAGLHKPRPLEAQLLHLQVERAMPHYADELSAESAEMQALFLLYANDPVLLLKARLALMRYPHMARPILSMYGADDAFQDVLRRFGEDVILPIHYFQTHEVFTLELMRGLNDSARSALNAVRRLWNGSDGSQMDERADLSADQRGWYAVQFLQVEGYDFLGQFVVTPDGNVSWLQTERVLEGINRFFASGLKGLESRYRRDETVTAGDLGWAALDVAIGVSAFKLLRLTRAGAAGARGLSFSQRSAALGAGLWRSSVIGSRIVKYGAPAVMLYVAVRHPSVINSLLGSAAEKLGLPIRLVQVVGWTLVLLPVIVLLHWVVKPLAWLLSGVVALLRWGDRALRRG